MGSTGQTLHIDRARRLVIVLNSAAERPTDRASGQARQEFIAAVNAELDAERRQEHAPGDGLLRPQGGDGIDLRRPARGHVAGNQCDREK